MEIKSELLELKQLNMEQKILIAIIEKDSVHSMKVYCNRTAGEIGKMIGLTRSKVIEIIWEVEEMGLISTDVHDRTRTTKTTPLYKRVITKDKEILIG